MTRAVEAELAGFPPSAVTVRVIQAVLAVLPGAPPFPPYGTLDEAAAQALGGVPDDVLARGREIASGTGVDQALFAAKSIDTGDTGITIVSGVRSAIALFFGTQESRSEALAQQQRTDAALKALALAYLVTKLVPLPPAQRMELVRSVPAGHELMLWYGAIDIALPFAAEVQAKEGRFVRELVDRQGGAMGDKLLGIVGRQGVADAQEMLGHLVQALDEAAVRAVPHTTSLAERVKGMLPGSGLGGDLFDLVAAGADALPAYRYLCARLAVEASLALAKHERMPEIALATPAVATPPPPAPPVPPELAAAPNSVVPGSLPGNPFEAPVAPAAAPVADVPVDVPAPPPENPFADGIVPPEPDVPPPPPPEPAFAWPTTPLPEAERLRGCFLEEGAATPAWRIFTLEGVFTDHPPEAWEGVDWDRHRALGHRVALYRRAGDVLNVTSTDGATEAWPVARDTYTIVLDGRTWRRTDWDLTGRALDGRYASADGQELALSADGTAIRGGVTGRYRLAVGSVAFDLGGATEARTFLSDLRPSSKRPAVLWIGGVRFEVRG